MEIQIQRDPDDEPTLSFEKAGYSFGKFDDIIEVVVIREGKDLSVETEVEVVGQDGTEFAGRSLVFEAGEGRKMLAIRRDEIGERRSWIGVRLVIGDLRSLSDQRRLGRVSSTGSVCNVSISEPRSIQRNFFFKSANYSRPFLGTSFSASDAAGSQDLCSQLLKNKTMTRIFSSHRHSADLVQQCLKLLGAMQPETGGSGMFKSISAEGGLSEAKVGAVFC